MAERFWYSSQAEPKRAFRWILSINDIPAWVCAKTDKPSFTVSESTHAFLNYVYKYPGRLTWNDITVTLKDPIDPDVAKRIMYIMENAGYRFPETYRAAIPTITKASSVAEVTQFKMTQVDGDGNELESWELINPWVKEVSFGTLDYEDDGLVNVDVTFAYDYAQIGPGGAGSGIADAGSSR